MSSELNKADVLPSSEIRRNFPLYVLALLQGVILLAVYKAMDNQVWPYADTVSTTILLSVFIPIPLIALLSVTTENYKRAIKYLLIAMLVYLAIGAYVGYQLQPFGLIRPEPIIFIYSLTLALLSFKTVMYLQQFLGSQELTYSSLYQYSWRNFLAVIMSLAFTGAVWAILMLWASLFKVLEIKFFHDLFTSEWFAIPVSVFAFGVAITIIRDLEHLLDNSSRIPQALIKFLLPMLIIISVTFLVTIPFRGLHLLWQTGIGSSLALWLQALTLFFFNTVYCDDPEILPYSRLMHRVVTVGIGLLPIYSCISFYGLTLRIDQYGLTVSRCWALVVWFFLACFALSYLWSMIKKRDDWIRLAGKVNIRMGLLLLITMILVNTPLIDFRVLSLNSQFARLESKQIAPEDFDFDYVSRQLGYAGYQRIQQYKEDVKSSSPELYAELDKIYEKDNRSLGKMNEERFRSQLIIWPSGSPIPDSVVASAYEWIGDYFGAVYASKNYYLLLTDLNQDDVSEYVIVIESAGYSEAGIYKKDRHGKTVWQRMSSNWSTNQSLGAVIRKGDIHQLTPNWRHLKIGDVLFRVNEFEN